MACISVIDDDPVIRSLVSSLLEAKSHTVALAANGRQGTTLFKDQKFDLVITDIVMPEQEGIETIGAIRRQNRSVPILAISGSRTIGESGDYLRAASALGATATLAKPLTPAGLAEVVQHLPIQCAVG